MKITPKQYAQILYWIVQDKNEQEISSVIKKFAQVLINNNDTAKIKEITDNFNHIWNVENQILPVEIVGARKLDKNILELLNSYTLKLSGAKDLDLEQSIDENILSGFVIKYRDKILDGSLSGQIKEMRSLIK